MILIVDDEVKLATLLQDYLRADGFVTHMVHDGRTVMDVVREHRPDLVLLDVMLPGVDGLTLCRRIKDEHQVPVILVTARGDEIDRVHGLELADDYVCKPFSPREVVARVKARLRTTPVSLAPGSTIAPSPIAGETVNGLRLLHEHGQAIWNGQVLDLTPVEFRLLAALAQTPGLPWTRERLMDRLYNDHRVVSDRTVDTHVKNLRRKLPLRSEGKPGLGIDGVYGRGYRLMM